MKEYACNVIQDLLPLYEDNCCSEDSRKIVDKHLSDCECCRIVLGQMRGVTPVAKPAPTEDIPAQTLKKGMNRIRKALLATLLAVVLVFGIGAGILYLYGTGIKVDNLDEFSIANSYLEALKQGNFEEAYSYYAIDAIRQGWLNDFFDEKTLKNVEADGLAKFLECMQPLKEAGLTDYQFRSAVSHDYGGYTLYYTVTVGGQKQDLTMGFQYGKLTHVGGGYGTMEDPGPLTMLWLWIEYLWQDYAGVHYVPGEGYVPHHTE